MKRIAITVVLAILSISLFGQTIKHNVELETGFSMVDEAKGPCLGVRYLMGLNPYFNLTASLASYNGFYLDNFENYHHYSSYFYSANIGVGGQVGFLKICCVRLLAEGGAAMFAKDNTMYLHPSVSGTGEFLVQLCPVLQIGAFIGKTWMLCGETVLGAVGNIGLVLNFNIN